MTEETDAERETTTTDHLDGLPDGSGCTEIWAYLSRGEDGAAESDERD